jgi:hypothetical protein
MRDVLRELGQTLPELRGRPAQQVLHITREMYRVGVPTLGGRARTTAHGH